MITPDNLFNILENKYLQYNNPRFIEADPISIPHQFSIKQDIEIMGFFAAILAWGQRKTIINNCNKLIKWMDNKPFDFIVNHQASDLKPFLGFKHRTFNDTDLLYFLAFFKDYYSKNLSLENAFIPFQIDDTTIETGLIKFKNIFFNLDYSPNRTKKHISSPAKGSACKRLNMYLRWMVRKDNFGVDFGLWQNIQPKQLVCPCDVHVDRVGRHLGLISRKQTDWKTALELTESLRKYDVNDPVKYDFALFGMGVESEY